MLFCSATAVTPPLDTGLKSRASSPVNTCSTANVCPPADACPPAGSNTAAGHEPLLRLENAAFSYEGRHAACDLNFTVNAGDYLCIIGPNGSGKSTLINGLLGLKAPSSGSLIRGSALKNSQVGYLPQQQTVAKDFPASVWEVVLSGRLGARGFRPFYTHEDKQIAAEKLALVHATDLKRRCFRELSGGQQQRVLLARALCAAGQLLLMDEPTTGLDPLLTRELYELIAQLNARGLTVIVVSHDVESALAYAGTILHLETHQRFFGTVAHYRSSGVGDGFIGCTHGEGHDEQEHAQRGSNV